MKKLKNPLSVRGDSIYCPLAFSLDSYWNCLCDCLHCYLRKMNFTWGKELRPADVEIVDRKLANGPKNNNPKSPLAWCLKHKKTIRWGNKTDPFQPIERQYKISKQLFKILIQHNWTFVIQTMCTEVMMDYERLIQIANERKLITIMPVISPGLERDWVLFEKETTTNPLARLAHAVYLQKQGVPVGINGEPFIPGFHTIEEFEYVVSLLSSAGIKSYNIYNFHFNAFVARRLHAVGVDIEKIWRMNQDKEWKPILQRLLKIAEKYKIILGCPDFVNTGPKWKEKANTCCGIDVQNPCTFNTHYWKKLSQEGRLTKKRFQKTWDGTGDLLLGADVVRGTQKKFFTLKDAGVGGFDHE